MNWKYWQDWLTISASVSACGIYYCVCFTENSVSMKVSFGLNQTTHLVNRFQSDPYLIISHNHFCEHHHKLSGNPLEPFEEQM